MKAIARYAPNIAAAVLVGGATALSHAAESEGPFSYTFVEVSGGYLDDGFGEEPFRAVDLRLSLDLVHDFHVVAGFRGNERDVDLGPNTVNESTNTWRVGVGYRAPVGPSTDLVARLEYQHTEYTFSSFEEQREGALLVAGLRHRLSPMIDIETLFGFDTDNKSGELDLLSLVRVHENVGLGLRYIHSTGYDFYGLTARISL